MGTAEELRGQDPAWCPGCGNFGILRVFRETLAETGIEPHQFTIVSGIGQAGKFPHYVRCNTFNGLHGRALPVATGIRLANHKHLVMVVTGDGDCYGEGGNHLLHAIRRNINIKLFVHDNQIYGLTKGQASPTTMSGIVTKTQPFGVLSGAMNPMALGVAMDCSFVARSFAGDSVHLKGMIRASIEHKGFSLLDILQPCVTFNRVNTHKWYKERVYRLGEEYNPGNRSAAFNVALEWGDRIPLGIIYKNERQTMEERHPLLAKGVPLADHEFDPSGLSEIFKEFY